jgi:glycosyltransferase involved in cell wall biosynthesis
MKATVAICTWNRCRLLAQTLEYFERLMIPSGLDWELLIVDNASTDSTRSVIKSFERKLPIEYLHQPTPGHCHSRNCAIEFATGDLMIWTDDDVLVHSDWLVAYIAGAAKYQQVAFFGGPIVPVFELGQPKWLTETWDKCSAAFAARDLGETELTIPPAKFPFGANFAVRTKVQKKFPFDASLGRRGKGMMGEDEIDLFRRLVQAGHLGIWLPAAKLEHFISANRATPEYVGRYFVGQGWANVRKGLPTFHSRFHAWRVAVHNRICYWLKRNRTVADEWLSHLIRSSIAWGEYQAWPHRTKRQSELKPKQKTGGGHST